MAGTSNYSACITLGDNALMGLSKRNELMFSQEFAPGLETKVNLGKMTVKRLEELQGYLERLKAHAVN